MLMTNHANTISSKCTDKELQRLLSIATSTDTVGTSKKTIKARETARLLLSDLLLLLYRGDEKVAAENRITSLFIDLLQEGFFQQYLCFRLLLTMLVRNHQEEECEEGDEEKENMSYVTKSLFSITQILTSLLLNVRPVASDETWRSAANCIMFFMSTVEDADDGHWIDVRVLVELVRRLSRTDSYEETLSFCEVLFDQLKMERFRVLQQMGGIETLSDLFTCSTSEDTRDLLMEMILDCYQHMNVNRATNRKMPLNQLKLLTKCHFEPKKISSILYDAINVHPIRWSNYLFESFGLTSMYLEQQTLHEVTKSVLKKVLQISVEEAKETSLILMFIHHTIIIRNSKCLMECVSFYLHTRN